MIDATRHDTEQPVRSDTVSMNTDEQIFEHDCRINLRREYIGRRLFSERRDSLMKNLPRSLTT